MKISKSELVINIITIISIGVMLWGALSYIDIVAHNLTTQNYSNFNLWCMLLK